MLLEDKRAQAQEPEKTMGCCEGGGGDIFRFCLLFFLEGFFFFFFFGLPLVVGKLVR